jgi:protein-S-isoprenylcysteine O-methyltransferase Ste14
VSVSASLFECENRIEPGMNGLNVQNGGAGMDQFKEWAKREYSSRQRIFAILLAGTLFVLIIPLGIAIGAGALDRVIPFPRLHFGMPNIIAGATIALIGWALAMWSIVAQFRLASGTPLPFMPTRKLIITGPFLYSRNPMTLGALLGYFGEAVILGSISALIIVLVLTVILLLYLKVVEEKELEARFGDEYTAYRKTTPFMFPRLGRRRE